MHPTHIIIVFNDRQKNNIITATIAYSEEEANEIASGFDDNYHFVTILEVDYSIRGE
jgi:hypothetical protein